MITITTILGIATGTLTVTTIAAVAWAALRQNFSKETVRLLNESIDAYKERDLIVDKKFKDQDKRIRDLEVKNASLQGELDTFKSVPLAQIADSQMENTRVLHAIGENQRLIMEGMKIKNGGFLNEA